MSLVNLRIGRVHSGPPAPGYHSPDLQIERLLRDVTAYLAEVRAENPPTEPTADELALYLQDSWPGASVETVNQYYWYITPGGQRIWVCLGGQVVVTRESDDFGGLQAADPPLAVGFQSEMT